MAKLWGELVEDDTDGQDREVFPRDIVKYFIIQAMHLNPFRTPPPFKAATLPDEEADQDTQGLGMDDRVIHCIKLLQHAKDMTELIESAKERTEEELANLPPPMAVPDHPVPPLKHDISRPLRHMNQEFR